MSLVIDNHFRPDIQHHVDRRGAELMELWEVDPIGKPITGLLGNKTALWHGQRYNAREETISVVMSLDATKLFPDDINHALFFFGLPLRQEIEIAEVSTDALADAATFLWTPPSDHLPLKYLFETIRSYTAPPRERQYI